MTTKTLDSQVKPSAGFFDAAKFSRSALESPRALASVFDHTLLAPEAVQQEIVRLCEEAVAFGFACAMVAPCWIPTAHSVLAGSGVPVGTTIGFPLGTALARSKREEAAECLKLGARELDAVMNTGWIKSGMNEAVEQELRALVEVAHDAGASIKVILEAQLLTVEQKLRGAEIAIQAGADFLKTGTGFLSGGAAASDVALLRGVAGNRCGIKASGGISTLASVRVMLEAGASRLGSRESVGILRSWDTSASVPQKSAEFASGNGSGNKA